jgi:hypothetical protein
MRHDGLRSRLWLALLSALSLWLLLSGSLLHAEETGSPPSSARYEQTSPAPASPSPITSAEIARMRLDLSLLIGQRDYWKDRSERFERAVTQRSEKLANIERSLKDSPDPLAMEEEIQSLREQLSAALASSIESRSSLELADRKVAEAEARIHRAEQEAASLERQVKGWRAAAIAAGLAALGATIWAVAK